MRNAKFSQELQIQVKKRSELFICAHNETLPVPTMSVGNEDPLPGGINRCDTAQLQPDGLSLSAMISCTRLRYSSITILSRVRTAMISLRRPVCNSMK